MAESLAEFVSAMTIILNSALEPLRNVATKSPSANKIGNEQAELARSVGVMTIERSITVKPPAILPPRTTRIRISLGIPAALGEQARAKMFRHRLF